MADTAELVRRAEHQVADGDPGARKTIERARRRLLDEHDADGLAHLLDLAGRLDDADRLTFAIRQNLAFVNRFDELHPDGPGRSLNGWVTALLGVLGAVAGGAGGAAFTFWLLSGTDSDAFVWLAALILFVPIGLALGATAAVVLGRIAFRIFAGSDPHST